MSERSTLIASIRPEIKSIPADDIESEIHFQNEILRPVLKFQNDLLIQVLKHYFFKHKNTFYTLSLEKRLSFIENAVQKDVKFRNALKGMIIGQFSVEEYVLYRKNASKLNKRMMQMLIQRYHSQIQLFENP